MTNKKSMQNYNNRLKTEDIRLMTKKSVVCGLKSIVLFFNCLLFTMYYLLLLHGCAPVYKIPPQLVSQKAPSRLPSVGQAMSIRVLLGTKNELEFKGKALSVKTGTRELKQEGSTSGTRLIGDYFKANSSSISLDNTELNNIQLPIEIISDDIIAFENKRFEGSFLIYKKGTSFMVVNKVDIENYLKGVVPHELRTDKLEALKAQTVACRSYALSSIKPDADYDVTATVADQVYNGVGGETALSNRAIEETRGVVCTYEGKISYTQYSSSCGGRTASGKFPYLKSRQCQFCETSKRHGHGIGLCQHGAVGMAKRGFNYKSILQYYYSDVRVEKIY